MLARRASPHNPGRATSAALIACTALDVLAECLRERPVVEHSASDALYCLAKRHAESAQQPDMVMWEGSSLSLERLAGRHEGAATAYEHAATILKSST